MKDWRAIASGMQLGIPGEELDRIIPVMEALEAAFRPLVARIPQNVEPAVILSEPAVKGE